MTKLEELEAAHYAAIDYAWAAWEAYRAELHLSILQEMREETCNGYPMYPELHL